MTELDLQTILSIIKDMTPKPQPALQHKQFIDGRLWLTEEQYESIKGEIRYAQQASDAQRMSNIPIELARDAEPYKLSDGRILVYSKKIGSFLIWTPHTTELDQVFNV